MGMAGSNGVEWNREAAQLYNRHAIPKPKRSTGERSRHSKRTVIARRLNRAITLKTGRDAARSRAVSESETLHLQAIPALEAATGKTAWRRRARSSNGSALVLGPAGESRITRVARRPAFAAMSSQSGGRCVNGQILATIYLSEHRYEDANTLLNRIAGSGEPLYVVVGYTNLSATALA